MIGFWDPACPVSTNHDKVIATTYVKEKEILNLPVYVVYTELQLRSYVDKCTKDYEAIVRAKQKKK